MKTMADKWVLFEAGVLRGNTNADGLDLGRLAFYSGAASLLNILLQPMDADERAETLAAIDAELRRFTDSIRAKNVVTHAVQGHA